MSVAKSLKTHSGPQVRDIAFSSFLVVIVTEDANRQGSKSIIQEALLLPKDKQCSLERHRAASCWMGNPRLKSCNKLGTRIFRVPSCKKHSWEGALLTSRSSGPVLPLTGLPGRL